jgi:hypothetical protein
MPCVFIYNECFVVKYPIAATDILEHCSTRTGDKRTHRSSARGTGTHYLSLQALEILDVLEYKCIVIGSCVSGC